jgi:hypothetical protein
MTDYFADFSDILSGLPFTVYGRIFDLPVKEALSQDPGMRISFLTSIEHVLLKFG